MGSPPGSAKHCGFMGDEHVPVFSLFSTVSVSPSLHCTQSSARVGSSEYPHMEHVSWHSQSAI